MIIIHVHDQLTAEFLLFYLCLRESKQSADLCYESSELIIIHAHDQLTAELPLFSMCLRESTYESSGWLLWSTYSWIHIVLSVFNWIITISLPLLWIIWVNYLLCWLSTNRWFLLYLQPGTPVEMAKSVSFKCLDPRHIPKVRVFYADFRKVKIKIVDCPVSEIPTHNVLG